MSRWATGAALLLGILLLGNGLMMLVAPEGWYHLVPGVADRGPFNEHFVRDIGIVYVLLGASFLAGARRVAERTLLWLAPTLWLAGHAAFHVCEVLVGTSGPGSLAQDFVGVILPALLGAALVAASRRHASTASQNQATS